VTRLGFRRYIDIFDKRTDPRGKDYYWMAGEPLELDENSPDTDVSACREGYIAITPIKIDLTSYREIEELKKWKF
jgi:5'-nucleotidase